MEIIFIDLQKEYDTVTNEILWKILKKKEVLMFYVRIIQDMNDEVITSAKSVCRESEDLTV